MMTDAELAILTIVAEGPIYGHDIQTVINQRGLRAWTNIGVSSMYYVLEKLERQGLIESQGQVSEGPSRRHYQITSAGFGVLQTSVADLISSPREINSGFELGLANLHVLRPAQIHTAFIAYRQEITSRLAQNRERWRQLQQNTTIPYHVDVMFRRRLAMLEAELEWLNTFIEEWETLVPVPDADAPEAPDIPPMKQVQFLHEADSPFRAPTQPLIPSSDPSRMETNVSLDTKDLNKSDNKE
jgi:DNA-binding PadR family transcriptional regulator